MSDITDETRSPRGHRRDRFGSLGNPKLAGLIGIAGLIVTVLGLGISYLSYSGDEKERAANAGPATRLTENAPHSATGPATHRGAAPVQADEARTPGIDDTFDLAVRGGSAYDVDLERDQLPTNSGTEESDSEDPERDLYRSSFETELRGWKLYVPQAPQRDVKRSAFQVMATSARPTDCPKLKAVASKGIIDGTVASVGMKACIKTSRGKWAMITIARLPQESDNLLHLKVTLLR